MTLWMKVSQFKTLYGTKITNAVIVSKPKRKANTNFFLTGFTAINIEIRKGITIKPLLYFDAVAAPQMTAGTMTLL